ncbi:hypothetical protein GCM10020219_034260 [Nonomuraea dietziae]
MSGMRSYGDPCGVARGLDVIGERWGPAGGTRPPAGSQTLQRSARRPVGRQPERAHPAATRPDRARRRTTPRPATPDPRPPLRTHRPGARAGTAHPLPRPLGQPTATAPDGLLGIDSIMLSIKAGFDPAQAAHLHGVYELHIDADTYFIEVTDDSLHISRDSAPTPPHATLTTDLDTLRAICDHQITLAAALDSGSLHLGGDEHAKQGLTDLLLASFMPAPQPADMP